MKICFLYESVFTLGGVQRCITSISNYLVRNGYDVSIICTNTRVQENRKTYDLDERVKVIFTKKPHIFRKIINRSLNKIRIINYKTGILKNNIKILDYIYYFYFGKYVQNIVNNEKFDVLIGCGVEHTKLASMIKGKNIKKIGWQHHNYEVYYENGKSFYNEDASVKEMFKNLDEYIVLTKYDKEKLKERKGLNSITIYNPIGFKQEEKSNLENKKFLALGRLNKIKGFDILIDNFEKFNRVNKEWTLDIVGDGPEKENLEEQIKKFNLEDYIRIIPRQNNVKELYKEASIYCMSSRSEGWGLVTLEAMESGLPVIAYDMPCVREIFVNNDGIIIPYGNNDKYVEAMLDLAENKIKREQIAEKSIERAKDFSEEKIGKEWEELLKMLVNKNR